MKSIELLADKIKINGPKVDGTFTVSLDVGEYEQLNIAQLVCIPQGTVVKVTISSENSD